MNLTKILRLASAITLVSAGLVAPAEAAVSVFWSAGATCGGATGASFSPGGPNVQMSLCMTTTAPTQTCGHTIVLQSAASESGRFIVTQRTLGPNYTDPNSEVSTVPLSVNNPALVADFGATGSAPVVSAANQLLATFDFAPQASATAGPYVISLASVSSAAVKADADSTCGVTEVPTEAALTASFTMTRINTPVFTSANATTFTTAGANSFTVSATGTPAPTLALSSGALPSGVTFAAGTGLLQGTPTTTGTFPLVFSATNTTTVTQNFTLTVAGQASQTISFANPGTQTFSASPIVLTATSSSGLPVTLSTITPSVCSIVGSNVTMLTLGQCQINANQAGNATYLAAPTVSQTFGIVGSVPGAPVIGAGTPGNGQASIAFTAPTSTGGSAITQYTATCGGISAVGTSSPITVSGLTNATPYLCSVTATNALGTGPASATVSVTPDAGTVLTLQAVKSRKTHATAGDFDITIDTTQAIGGTLTTEPRNIGTGHQLVFQFNNPITSAGTATAVDQAAASVTVNAPTFSGSDVTVVIPAIADRSRATVTLSNVNGSGLNFTVSLGFLVADANNNRIVNSGDINGTKARSGNTLDQTNFRFDFNVNGFINSGDINGVKARSGNALN